MNKKPLITIAVATVCGIIAIFLVNRYLTTKEEKLYKGMDMISVVAVTKDIAAGALINGEMLARRQIPSKYVHGNAVSPDDANLVVGQKLNFPLKRGDVLLWTDMGDDAVKLSNKSLARSITKEERALSVAVDAVGGVSGHLTPNDHVDILCTVTDRKTGVEATLTLLQNITVLATGKPQIKQRKRANYSTVTLLVTLEEAELLIFAQKKGDITLVLRHPENIETVRGIDQVSFSDIFQSAYREKIQKKRNRIEVIKKGKLSKDK